jgi:MFS family permease
MGKLADIFGFRRLVLAVALTYVVGSLIGALTSSFPLIMVARVLQAPAIAIPGVIYSFFRGFFPKRMVPIAIGMSSTGIGVAGIAAPLISGALLAAFGYHAIFWFCLIYMGVFAPIVFFVVPGGPRNRHRVDVLGSVLLTAGAGLLLFGVSEGPELGWTSPTTLVLLVAAVLLLVAFAVVEYRVREPMMDMRLLSGPALRATLGVSLLVGATSGGWGYVIPQLLEAERTAGIDYGFGLSATQVGLVTLSSGIVGMLFGPLGGYLARRFSPRLVMLWCGSLAVMATVAMAFWHSRLWEYVVFGVLYGAFNGFYFAAGPNLVIEAVPARLTGVSTGMQAFTSAFAGSAMPIVATVILSANVLHTDSATHQVVYASRGYTYVFLTLAVAGMVGFVLTAFMRHGRRPATGGAAAH